jgi:hypothetical protein
MLISKGEWEIYAIGAILLSFLTGVLLSPTLVLSQASITDPEVVSGGRRPMTSQKHSYGRLHST